MKDKPNLGLATTRELLEEIRARIEVDGKLDYRTWDGGSVTPNKGRHRKEAGPY